MLPFKTKDIYNPPFCGMEFSSQECRKSVYSSYCCAFCMAAIYCLRYCLHKILCEFYLVRVSPIEELSYLFAAMLHGVGGGNVSNGLLTTRSEQKSYPLSHRKSTQFHIVWNAICTWNQISTKMFSCTVVVEKNVEPIFYHTHRRHELYSMYVFLSTLQKRSQNGRWR